MDREILFRGRTIKTRFGGGKWIEGFFVMSCVGHAEMEPAIITGTEKGCFMTEFVDPATVGQYTGLCDKNGVKIFEGDKLYCEARLDKAEMYVVFEKGQFRMVLCDKFKEYETGRGYYDINCFQKTVIGNIHDNPELLEEKSE